MNTLDIVLGIILIIAFIGGFRKGLFVALASLIGLIAGIFGAVYFSDFAASHLAENFNWSEQTTQLAAFAVTFLVIVILISLAGKALTKIADFAMLGIINKILGGVFTVIKIAFILSVVFMFLNASNFVSIVSEEQKEESALYEPISSLAPMIMPHILQKVDEIETELDENDTSNDTSNDQ